ncbi:MAG: hypothetical protein US62_C0005G0026 [Candidatus Woesebacteria bacterium GW2011_GWA1_37_8]|uniref:Glycosyltransferase RgtA/B/C/D-like domain-containing protein n=2 Tax=Candidatus Woeseibacteriota TaxID=1752722 RepID=A0A0G0L6S7_9BACT|nr:MAG: hypothetical protein US39_C0005G0059 [Microgenomates group bacterium GW2011_GWC1_37_12b]KKQ46103.1 MAG: hypothetical protein US62_C0005G0026 [Candidatus Woesebacteria bacterium GW2011_GWA1_37_8]KKQ86712.1 MAG: hypothetical protein UT10_C0018G0024 [Candidatus Woesebacteria bacterium GW2011_GWB1_38_8b]
MDQKILLKKLFKDWKITIFIGLIILLIGTFLRTFNLTHLPVFGDEAIYIRWAQIMRNEPTLRFLPLSDGKQPLFMWVMMPFLKIFSDPLVAGRMVSVLTGLGTGIGIFVLSYLLLKSKNVSLASMFIYMIAPFGFFFDRLAMADSLLSFFGIWSVIVAILLVKLQRLDLAMILGFLLGGALLTKSPALFFSLLIPTTSLLVKFTKSKNPNLGKILKILLLFFISYFIAYFSYNFILRLGPNFHMIGLRNLDYVFPISHLWQNPKDPFIFHFDRAREWYVIYGSWWLVGLFLFGLANIKKYWKEVLVLIGLFIIPILVQSMFAKAFTTRYVFFTFPYYAILCGIAFKDFDFKKTYAKIKGVLMVLFAVQSIYFFFIFQTNLQKTPLARTDRSGFFEEWTSGIGIKESTDIIVGEYMKNPSKKIVVGTEGYFGTLPDGFQMYTAAYPISVIGVGIDLHEIPRNLNESVEFGNSTYLVINSSRLKMPLDSPEFEIVASFPKAFRPQFVHEYTLHGPRDTLYLIKIKNMNPISSGRREWVLFS